MYIVEIVVLIIFLIIIWPHVKKENWKAKFIEDKHARSILIIFLMILLFTAGFGIFFDLLFPVERLDR